MRHRMILALLFFALCSSQSFAAGTSGFAVNVLLDDAHRAEYVHRGTVYIEAVRGASYSLRLPNPTPYRVAVALSVDGLNTLDAKHTDPRSAAKWVLEPYESTVISGWQVSDQAARNFFFTGERHSYGASLGQTENLGVIEAVYFRERRHEVSTYQPWRPDDKDAEKSESAAGGRLPKPVPAPNAAEPSRKTAREEGVDDYAATGM